MRGHDAGASDVLGTILLIAVTVSLVGSVAVQVFADASAGEAPSRLEVRAKSNAAGTDVSVLHLSGTPLARDGVRFLVTVNDQSWHNVVPGPGGATWSAGEWLNVSVPTIPTGARVAVAVVDARSGAALATTPVEAVTSIAPAPPLGFLLAPLGSTPSVARPGTVLLEVFVVHPQGRKMVDVVQANATAVAGSPWLELRDDGTRGDRLAADGTWTAIVTVGTASPTGLRTIPLTAIALDTSRVNATALVQVV